MLSFQGEAYVFLFVFLISKQNKKIVICDCDVKLWHSMIVLTNF